METQENSSATAVKKTVDRSIAHPIYSVQESKDFVKVIYSSFGASIYASREHIAEQLGVSSVNSQLSTAVQYGLLELKSKEGYKPTDLYIKKLHRPIPEEEREALLIAFQNPPFNQKLIAAFNGQILPALQPLSNILFQKYDISERACEKAASVFIDTARSLGLLDDDNVLNINADADASTIEPEITFDKSPKVEPTYNQNQVKSSSPVVISRDSDNPNPRQANEDQVPFNIPLKGRRTAQIVIPVNCSTTDFDTIVDWVMLMKKSYVE